MKALLIDDERLARNELRRLLSKHPGIEIVGEAANAEAARKAIEEHHPDLLFLDVQMPGEDGFALLESLEPPHPHVIFATAHDEFAVRAFDENAIDYLLKPVDPARLAMALERLEVRAEKQAAAEEVARAGALAAEDKVFVREGERCWFVEVRMIRLLESEGNYTRLYFGDAKPLLFRSLTAMEERLSPKMFFRANRRQIINLTCVETIEPWFSGGLQVTIKGGTKVEISRRQAQVFREQTSL